MKLIKTDFLIIGAGISGLTTAFRLNKAGKNTHLVEASNVPGGAIKTIKKDGWICEAGPNTVLVTNTYFSSLIEELGLKESIVTASETANKRFILKNGIPMALPDSPLSFFRSPFFSTGAKMKLLAEPFRGRMKTEDETLSNFVKRRLGQEFLDYAINPFVAGVYAGSPDQLSVRYAFPKLYELEKHYGSLIIGSIKGAGKIRKETDIPRSKAKMVTFTEGNTMLTDRLSEALGNENQTYGDAVKVISKSNGGYTVTLESGKEIISKNIICTVPLHLLQHIDFTNVISAEELEKFAQVEYPPVYVLHFGFNKNQIGHKLDGFGMLVPEKEQKFILGALFNSSIFPSRTDNEEKKLITVFAGGSRHSYIHSMTVEDVLSKALADLKSAFSISGNPLICICTKWPKAIPQYKTDYKDIQVTLRNSEKANKGFHFQGNYLGGISVADCVKNSMMLADKLLAN